MGKDYGIEFVYCNFSGNAIRPKSVLADVKDEYVRLYNDYVKVYNNSIGPLNDLWETLKPGVADDVDEEVEACKYGMYLHDSLNTLCAEVAHCHADDMYYLVPFVFYGKEGPQFGCRLREHPELYMTHIERKSEK